MADDESTTGTDDSTDVDDDAPILPEESVEATETDSNESEQSDEAEETKEPEAKENTEAETTEEGKEDAEESEESPDPKEVARQAFQQRQADRQAREAQRQQSYQQWIQEAEDEKDQALRQMQTHIYETTVKQTDDSLVNDFEWASSNIGMFNPTSPEYNATALDDAINEYDNGWVNYDENGNRVGVKAPFKDYLKYKADLYGGLTQVGARKGQQAESKMRARAETPSSATTKESKGDPMIDAFNKEFDD